VLGFNSSEVCEGGGPGGGGGRFGREDAAFDGEVGKKTRFLAIVLCKRCLHKFLGGRISAFWRL